MLSNIPAAKCAIEPGMPRNARAWTIGRVHTREGSKNTIGAGVSRAIGEQPMDGDQASEAGGWHRLFFFLGMPNQQAPSSGCRPHLMNIHGQLLQEALGDVIGEMLGGKGVAKASAGEVRSSRDMKAYELVPVE